MKAAAVLVLSLLLAACIVPPVRQCERSALVVWCAFAKCDVKQAPDVPVTSQECKSMSMQHVGNGVHLVRIVELLSDLYEPEGAALWLRTPQASLDDKKPLDFFGDDAGELRVIEVLSRERAETLR